MNAPEMVRATSDMVETCVTVGLGGNLNGLDSINRLPLRLLAPKGFRLVMGIERVNEPLEMALQNLVQLI